MRVLYRGLEERHDFSAKFAVSEEDFLKGVMKNFRPLRHGQPPGK